MFLYCRLKTSHLITAAFIMFEGVFSGSKFSFIFCVNEPKLIRIRRLYQLNDLFVHDGVPLSKRW